MSLALNISHSSLTKTITKSASTLHTGLHSPPPPGPDTSPNQSQALLLVSSNFSLLSSQFHLLVFLLVHSSDLIWKSPSPSLFALPSTCHWVVCSAFQITCQNVSSKASIQTPPFYDSFPRFSWFSVIWKSIWRCVPVKSTVCWVPALPPNVHDVQPCLNIFSYVSVPQFLSRNDDCISTSSNDGLKSKMNWDVLCLLMNEDASASTP